MASSLNAESTAEEVVEQLFPYIKNKVILITGVSQNSLGAHYVEAVAKAQPRLLILAGRNYGKVEATAKHIESRTNVATRILELDLASLQKVREAAAIVNAYDESIDILVNNAGIMASDYFTTIDGLEGQFGTNHLGPWLFTNLVIQKLLSSSEGGRVVNITSNGYRLGGIRFYDYDFHVNQS